MFKALLIIFAFFFIIFRIGGFFMRLFFGGIQTRQQQATHRNSKQKYDDGNIHIDHIPDTKKEDFKGGDYIDYEELK
ncbi:MAG: hypothetical protein OEX22_12605 [Cyclobacteriaceae bacterium]|nr:hypothetical protein [Cyclobacteriaceae bacterium]